MDLSSYTIALDGLELDSILESWQWLLPSSYTIVLINRFGEVLFEDQTGTMRLLEASTGELRDVAQSRSELADVLDDPQAASDILMAGLVKACVEEGMRLENGQCYKFLRPPILGGTYETSNIEVGSLRVYLSITGQLHEQLKDVPDGTPIGNITLDGVPIIGKS